MRPQRSAVALGVMVAVLLVWLVVRSRIAPPPANPATVSTPAAILGETPTKSLAVSTPVVADPTTPSLQKDALPTAVPGPAPMVVASSSPVTPVPVIANAKQSSADSASVNAIRVRRMITDYHTLTGENPVGTNAEIMAAIMGNNPRHATLGPPEGFSVNSKGELVDEWGTPYFFHQLSRDVMEIHSAGPDKILGTADDVIVR